MSETVRDQTARHQTGRRGAPHLAGTLTLAVALAAGLVLGGGVAWAFWQGSAETQPAALRSGTFDLQVGGVLGTVLAGPGGSATIPELSSASIGNPDTGMTPGATDAYVMSVRNAGTAPFTPTFTATGTPSPGLGDHLVTTVLYGGHPSATAGVGAVCTGGTSTPPVLAPGQTVYVCLAVALAGDAPQQVQGQTGAVTIEIEAVQVRP